MKRLLMVLVPLLLIVGTIPPTVSANYGNCQSDAGHDLADFSWDGVSTGNVYFRTGTNARIDPQSIDFRGCSGNNTDGTAAAWVALVQANITDHYAIAQIGWLRSNNTNVCNGGTTTTYCIVWAVGGCGIAPAADDTGAIETTTPDHDVTFQVVRSGGYIHFYYDLAGGHNYTDFADVSTSDPELSCWANGNLQSEFFAERHDPADGIGTSAIPSTWTDMTTKYNGSWVTNNPSSCQHFGSNGDQGGRCSLPSAGTMDTWNI